jgi:hypothetical protein
VLPTAFFAVHATAVGLRLAAATAVIGLLFAGAGVQTRRRKAVHLFEEGIVLVGMWGQAKVVGRWPELTTWSRQPTVPNGGRREYGVALGGRRCFVFGDKQVEHGLELAEALAAGAAAGHHRALEESGSITFGAESTSDPLGPVRVTPEHVYLDRHNVKILISDISRVWIGALPFRGQSFEVLNVTTTSKPDDATMLTTRPADIPAAGELIASLAGMKVEWGKG